MTITPCANIHCTACSLFPEQLNGSGRALWTQAPRIPQNFIFRSQLLTGDQFLHCGPHLLIPTQILHGLVLSWLENTQCWYLYNRCIFVWVCQPIITLRIRWTWARNQNPEADSDLKKKNRTSRCCSFWFPFFDTLYISHICLCCCILLKGACILVILIQKMESSEMCIWKVPK